MIYEPKYFLNMYPLIHIRLLFGVQFGSYEYQEII